MKKLIIATCAASLFSTATLAAPKHVHKHQRQHAGEQHNKSDLHRDLFHFALFAGAVLAIDAALDDDKHHSKPHHGAYNKPAKPQRPHVDRAHAKRPHGNHHALGINARQDRQAARIGQGLRSGELVRPEAKRLREQQRRIAKLERDFRSDGKFSKKERRIIQAKLDQASERIYALKHNNRHRR